MTISKSIPPESLPLGGLALSKSTKSERSSKSDETMTHVKEYVNILCAADNPSINGRGNAFMSLTLGGGGGGGGSKKVSVEYEVIAKRLRASVLENLVIDRWGPTGLRIVNILRNCGKLDSDQVCVLNSSGVWHSG